MKQKRKFLLPVLITAALLLCLLVWLFLPGKFVFIEEDAPEIAAIEVCYYTNMGTATITDEDAIEYILSELRGVSFRRSGLVLGIHNSIYNIRFLTEDGGLYKEFHLGFEDSVQSAGMKYSVSMNYVPWDSSVNFAALNRYLAKALDWSEDSGEPFPAPPSEEDFQVPDIPTGDALAEAYPFSADQATLYIDASANEEGWRKFEVTDRDRIAKIMETVSVSTLQAIVPAEQYDCVPELYIDFHNGTVMGVSGDPSYLWFGNGLETVEDENGAIQSCALTGEAVGPYVANEEAAVYFAGLWLDYMCE